jgi:dolichol-phosphate mannosyltransferase
MLAVNMYATDALLRAAVEIDARFVNTGSSSEYGYKDHPPTENEVVRPNSYYAVTKAAATQLCQLAADQHGLPVATLRLYSVYGPWEEPGRLMPTLVHKCRKGTWPPLVGRETARDFVWIDDACEAFLRAATAELPEPGAVFNIATGSQTTLERLVAVAADVFSVQEEPQWGTMPQRSWDTSTWVGDPSRANSQLDWSASTPLEAGLASLGEWLGSHPEIEERYG